MALHPDFFTLKGKFTYGLVKAIIKQAQFYTSDDIDLGKIKRAKIAVKNLDPEDKEA